MKGCVVIAGGGTGGHIFPGLAVAEALQDRGLDIHWLGSRHGLESDLVGKRQIPITLVEIEGIRSRRPAAAARALAHLPRAAADAVRVLLTLDPLAVIGVGGYASAAGVMAAGFLGLPWVLQEQNSVPGLTNRMLAPWADLICCGFSDALATFASLPAEWTGNPVRAEFFGTPALRPHDPPRVLVLGGSQGSLFLNRAVPRALATLSQAGIHPEIRHQAGLRWADVVRTSYEDLGLEATVSAFLSEPWLAMADADLVIARAGALTLSELAAAGRGALLVPFAAAAGDHQAHNARSMKRSGGALVLSESEASPQRMARTLEELLADTAGLEAMASCARSMSLPNAAQRIAEALLAVGGSR